MIKRYWLKFLAVLLAFILITVILPTISDQFISPDHEAKVTNAEIQHTPDDTQSVPSEQDDHDQTSIKNDPDQADDTQTDEPSPDDPDEPTGPAPFEPYAVEETRPELMLSSWATMADGEIVDSFSFSKRIDFGYGNDYSWIEGITTFRGNNFRNSAAYGHANIQNAQFGDKWSRNTGSYTAPDGVYWSGHGWTGQPLIVKWPKETRAVMNMHDWAKEREELVEVIYPSMDGYVYFAELETGEATRDKLFLGYTFKGAGSIDPRGYPLLYVGAGYTGAKGSPRILIVSLIDGSVLHTFGYNDSFAPRGWFAADAAPLIDVEADRLIYPSECGVIYIMDLCSSFDPVSGTVSISPSAPVKWRYKGLRSQAGGKYWLGIEASPVIWRGHLFFADNGGHLVCLDLNTLEPVWVRDVLDDTNCSPVLELEDGNPYIYISTGFHGGWRAPMNSKATVPIWKIDAKTGETVWQTEYDCYTVSGVSGGVQGTAALGKDSLGDYIYVPVARTPTRSAGTLAALDKRTGDIAWEFETSQYSWSSPVCLYGNDGKGYIIYTTAGGYMYLLDGLTGELYDSVSLGGTLEASPAVYGNTVVVGTRAMKIWGVTLT